MNRAVAPPSGMAPPETATTPGGHVLDLAALANEVCGAYDAEFPDERERYGPAGMQWCRHDNQHLLAWAVLSLDVGFDFRDKVAWLARVLEARDFPLDRLARDLELLAEVVARRLPGEPGLAAVLQDGGAFVRSRGSFLS